jgi:hypothetical protein
VLSNDTCNGRVDNPIEHLGPELSVVLTCAEAGKFAYVMQKGCCFYETRVQPGAVAIQPVGQEKSHFGNQKAVPANVFRHIKLLEQFQAFGSGRDGHFDS